MSFRSERQVKDISLLAIRECARLGLPHCQPAIIDYIRVYNENFEKLKIYSNAEQQTRLNTASYMIEQKNKGVYER